MNLNRDGLVARQRPSGHLQVSATLAAGDGKSALTIPLRVEKS